MKIRLHPLFVLLALFFIFTGRAVMFGGYVVAVIAHELAHSRAAAWRGYKLGNITLMPYGGVIDCTDGYADKDGVVISLAAPLFNATVAVCVVALWWLIPDSYSYTKDICSANLALCIVNLLPVYPLDGYRAAISFAKNKTRALRVMKATGIAVGICFAALGVTSVWFEFNPTIILFGFFLVYEAVFGSGGERIAYKTANNVFYKNFGVGVEKKSILIEKNAPLLRALAFVNRNDKAVFEVVSQSGETLCVLEEEEIGVLCEECELSDSIAEAYAKVYGEDLSL